MPIRPRAKKVVATLGVRPLLFFAAMFVPGCFFAFGLFMMYDRFTVFANSFTTELGGMLVSTWVLGQLIEAALLTVASFVGMVIPAVAWVLDDRLAEQRALLIEQCQYLSEIARK